MLRTAGIAFFGLVLFAGSASAQSCSGASWTSFINGTTANASQVNDNFTCVLSSPVFAGSVGVGGSTTAPFEVYNASGGYEAYFTAGSTNTVRMAVRNQTSQGQLEFVVAGGGSPVAVIQTGVTANIGLNFNASSFIFNNGSVGIGTAPSYTLHVNGSVAGTSAYVNLSDERLKKNIEPIRDALATVEHLQGVRFSWKTTAERKVGRSFSLPIGERQVGFIAQDVEQILPEAVSTATGQDAIKSVAESKIVPVLVEAIKEQTTEIRELRATNDKQATEIAQMRNELADLEARTAVRSTSR